MKERHGKRQFIQREPMIALISSTRYTETSIISIVFNNLRANTHVTQCFDCRSQANPVCCVSRAVAVVRSAFLCEAGALRRQSPNRAGLAPPQDLGAAGLRKDCQAGGGYRKPEVGRTQLWSGDAMLPRLGQCLAVRRVDGAPSPSPQRGGLAAGRSRR